MKLTAEEIVEMIREEKSHIRESIKMCEDKCKHAENQDIADFYMEHEERLKREEATLFFMIERILGAEKEKKRILTN